MLVLLNVADWSDTDINDKGHAVGQRVIAARAGISLRYCRTLMDQAAEDGWLIKTGGKPGKAALWKLGPNCAQLRAVTAQCDSNDAQPPRRSARRPRTKKHTDVGRSPTYTQPHAPTSSGRAPPASDSHVPPAPPPPVEIVDPDGFNRDPEQADADLAHDYLAAMREHLHNLRRPILKRLEDR